MNVGDMIRSGDPRTVSRVISLLLAVVITFSGCFVYDRFVSGTAENASGKVPSDGREDGTEGVTGDGTPDDLPVSATPSALFSDTGALRLGSEVAGRCAMVVDLRKLTVVADKGMNIVTDCGDSTVFMVALIISEKISNGELKADDEAVCPASAMKKYGYTASSAILPVGKKMHISDLLRCMLYQNGSTFAYTLAVHASGSEDAFTAEMNAKADLLGMEDTLYTNVCGEDDGKSHTTVYDLSVLMKYFLDDPYLLSVFTSKDAVKVKNSEMTSSVYLTVENDFFLNCCTPSQAKADGIKGGKCGECGSSGWCVLLIGGGFTDSVVVIMNSRSSFSDSLKAYVAASGSR